MSHYEINEQELAAQIADHLKDAVTAELVQHLVSHSLIGIDAACEYLGTGRTWLHELSRRGKIRSVRIGNKRMFRLEWLDEYVDAQQTGPRL